MILGIEGSPRARGNSHLLLQTFMDGVYQAGGSGFQAHLRDYRYEPCIGCERCRKDKTCTRFQDGMTLLYPRIDESQGLILVSPVHNYNITAWMKAFIDRLYCYLDFEDTRPRAWSSRLAGQGRKAIIAAIAEQEERKDMGFALEAMRLPLQSLGYEIVAEFPVLRLFDRGIISRHTELLDQARQAGRELTAHLE